MVRCAAAPQRFASTAPGNRRHPRRIQPGVGAKIEGVGRNLQSPRTAGEVWAEDLLDELRRARFTPPAWRRFVAASLARASHNRKERVQAHRQVVALGVIGVAAGAVIAVSGWPLPAAIGAAWWLLVLLMVDWHLGMLERVDGTPLPRLGIANALSLGRAAAIPLLPLLTPTALGLTLGAAAVTDVADGFLARARRETSRLGAWLDGAVDGILLGIAAVAAANRGLVPTWVAALVVFRYLVPWPALAASYFVSSRAPNRDRFVSGRIPGAAVVCGLTFAAFGLPAAEMAAAAGAVGGLGTISATFVLSLRRARRAPGRGGRAAPRPAARPASPPGRDGSSASIAPRSNASASRARTPG